MTRIGQSGDWVCLMMTQDEVKDLSTSIADILCWCAGFSAARAGTELDGGPMGLGEIRDLNVKLKSALDSATSKENAQ